MTDTHPNTDPHTLSRIAHRVGQPYRDLTCDTRDNLELRIARRGGWEGSLTELAAVTQHKPGTANGNLERRQ